MAKPCGPPAPWIFHEIYHGGCLWAGCFKPTLGYLELVLGLSCVLLSQFWVYLTHLAGIYCLLEAMLANLADTFVFCDFLILGI